MALGSQELVCCGRGNGDIVLFFGDDDGEAAFERSRRLNRGCSKDSSEAVWDPTPIAAVALGLLEPCDAPGDGLDLP